MYEENERASYIIFVNNLLICDQQRCK